MRTCHVDSLMHKRKHRKSSAYQPKAFSQDETSAEFDPSLYVVAYEADIVGGPRAVSAALALECPEADGVDKSKGGTALVRFEPQNYVVGDGDADVLWVDRYVHFALCMLGISGRTPRSDEGMDA